MPGRGGPTRNFYEQLRRVHVNASNWVDTPGTDFWLMPQLLSATATAGFDTITTSDAGWTMEAEHGVIGSASEFRGGVITAGVPATPGVPTHHALLATGDLVVSPPIFGGYDHMLAASWLMGKDRNQLPKKLVMNCRAAFTTSSSNEPTSGFGFFEDSTTTTSATEALQFAFISSDSANFQLATNASSTLVDVGEAVSAVWREWSIVIDFDSAAALRASWYINGSLQGSIAPTATEAPYAFGMHTLTNNVLLMGPVHIFYEW